MKFPVFKTERVCSPKYAGQGFLEREMKCIKRRRDAGQKHKYPKRRRLQPNPYEACEFCHRIFKKNRDLNRHREGHYRFRVGCWKIYDWQNRKNKRCWCRRPDGILRAHNEQSLLEHINYWHQNDLKRSIEWGLPLEVLYWDDAKKLQRCMDFKLKVYQGHSKARDKYENRIKHRLVKLGVKVKGFLRICCKVV